MINKNIQTINKQKNLMMKKTLAIAISTFALATNALAQEKVKTVFDSGTTTVEKEGAAMAADGKLYTKWCIDDKSQLPYTIVLDAKQPTKISEYGLVTGDDTSIYTGRNPQTWKVWGSNDKKTWESVDEMKLDRRMREENEQEYRYKVKDVKSYRYYMFKFLMMTEGTRLQLSEINLYK